MKKLLLIIATGFLIQICNAQTGTVTDIDGNIYQTVTIGTQVWMKENLKTIHYRNGDSIGTTYPATLDYMNESTPKYQWSYNNDSLATIYGRLYTWHAITDTRKVCPAGWHVPTVAECRTLVNFLGGDMLANGKLKETGTYIGISQMQMQPTKADLQDFQVAPIGEVLVSMILECWVIIGR